MSLILRQLYNIFNLSLLRGVSHRKWHFSNLAYFETLGHEITKKMSPTPNGAAGNSPQSPYWIPSPGLKMELVPKDICIPARRGRVKYVLESTTLWYVETNLLCFGYY